MIQNRAGTVADVRKGTCSFGTPRYGIDRAWAVSGAVALVCVDARTCAVMPDGHVRD